MGVGMGPFGDEGAHCSSLSNSVGGDREGDGAGPTPIREGDGGGEGGGGQCIFAGGEAVQLVGSLLDSPSGVLIGECVSAEVGGDDDGGMPGCKNRLLLLPSTVSEQGRLVRATSPRK